MTHQWIIFNSPLAKGDLRYLDSSESCKYMRFINKGIYGCLMLRLLYQDIFSVNKYGNLLLRELMNSDLWNFLLLKHYTESRDIITAPVHQLFIDTIKGLARKTNKSLVERLSTDLIKEYQRKQLEILHNRVKSVKFPHPIEDNNQRNTLIPPNRHLPITQPPTQSTPLDLRKRPVQSPNPRIAKPGYPKHQFHTNPLVQPAVLPRSRPTNISCCPPSVSRNQNTPFVAQNLLSKKQLVYSPQSSKSQHKPPTHITLNNSKNSKK